MVDTENVKHRYWLWVTHPEYYLGEDGSPREDLEPGYDTGDGWWTCSKDTKAGDLVLLYRTSPMSDIAYFIQAQSDAFPLSDDDYARDHGWAYGCEYQSLFRFEAPVTIGQIKDDAALEDWPALRGRFQGKAFVIAPDIWQRLTQLLSDSNPGFRVALETAGVLPQEVSSEKDMEDRLTTNLRRLKEFGYDIELYHDDKGRTGRQFVCSSIQGRMDLLCQDRANGDYVVIELKANQAGDHAYAQVQAYMGWVMDNLPEGARVHGLVISYGTNAWFDSAMHASRGAVEHLNWKELGL
jgi:hypothetical protein